MPSLNHRTVTYYLEDSLLGRGLATREPTRFYGNKFPHSHVYICPKCGAAWGRIEVDGMGWLPHRALCRRHGPGLLFPHSAAFISIPKRVYAEAILAICRMKEIKYLDIYLLTGDHTI